LKYKAAGATGPEVHLSRRNGILYTIFGDRFWLFNTIIRTNMNRMTTEGVPVDTIAASMDDLTESSVTYQPWFRPLACIPLISRSRLLMHALSSITLLLLYIFIEVWFIISFFLIIFCFMGGVFYPPMHWPKSRPLPRRLPEFTFPGRGPTTHPTPPPESSSWIKKLHLINPLNDIKRNLYFALRSSAPSQQNPSTQMSKEERITSLYRTLIGNRTIQGAIPPPEWETMFHVLINGPSLVPSAFIWGAPAPQQSIPSSEVFMHGALDQGPAEDVTAEAQPFTLNQQLDAFTDSQSQIELEDFADTQQLTPNPRAQAYVQPLIKSIWHSLYKRKVSITKEGHLGLADEEASSGNLVSVFLGCGFPAVLTMSGRWKRSKWNSWRNVRGQWGRSGTLGKLWRRGCMRRRIWMGLCTERRLRSWIVGKDSWWSSKSIDNNEEKGWGNKPLIITEVKWGVLLAIRKV
jgi:hypothetical protein